jgi:alkaline phosphatase
VSSRRGDKAAAGTPLKTILEYAEERGLSTGIVTNDGFMASATAAACYAHVDHRHKFRQIYDDFLSPRFGDGVDLVVARAADSVENSMTVEQAAQLPTRGYGIYNRLGDLHRISEGAPPRALVFLPSDDAIDLEQATTVAIRLLRRNPRGFFLMVESDAHSEDVPEVLNRTVELDRVVRVTAAANRHDTLVLFTADHSFDLRVPQAEIGGDIVSAIKVRPFHTGEEVLVAAEGPAADRVRGIMPNTELFHVMLAAYGWTP